MDPLSLSLLAGGSVVSGGLGALGSYLSSQQQLQAAQKAQGAITNAYNTATSYQQPYQQAGLQGLSQLQQGNFGTAVPGQYQGGQAPTYTAPTFNFQQQPGYQFQLQQGQNAALSSAAGRGAGLSGATLKALSTYGTGVANQSYGQDYDQYMQGRQQGANEYNTQLGQFNQNRQFGAGQQQQQYENANQQQMQRYGQAANLSGIGQQAAGTLGQMATGYGNNLAGLYGQAGNAQAAGTMGTMQGLGQIGSGLSSMGMLNGLQGRGNNNTGYGGSL